MYSSSIEFENLVIITGGEGSDNDGTLVVKYFAVSRPYM